MDAESSLLAAVYSAAEAPPTDYSRLMGWVLIAFQNALWQLLHDGRDDLIDIAFEIRADGMVGGGPGSGHNIS